MSKILDAWIGETVTHHGRRYFEIDGVLVPADEAVTRAPSIVDRLAKRQREFLGLLARGLRATGQRRDLPLKFQPTAGGQGWEEVLDTQVADGTQISNTTVETILAPDFSVPAFYMLPGRTLRLWAFGVNSNVVTTPGTLTFRVRWGGVSGTVLLASAAQGLDTTAHTGALWSLTAYIVCRTVGASGSFMSGGQIALFNLLSSTAANLLPALLGSAGTPGGSNGNAAVTVDTTAAKLLSLTAAFSVSTSPTNLTCQQRIIEALN